MAQHAISDEARDTLLAAAKIGAAASATVAGVLDHQTSDELDELIDTIDEAVKVLEARRDSLVAQESGQQP